MIDKKKVVKGLECCSFDRDVFSICNDCPYSFNEEKCENNRTNVRCCNELKDDLLLLLKEQEAVEPTFKQDNDGIVWACGSCGAYMYHIGGISKAKEYAKYCRQCGRKVKWDA